MLDRFCICGLLQITMIDLDEKDRIHNFDTSIHFSIARNPIGITALQCAHLIEL